jgi:hypothetical protein
MHLEHPADTHKSPDNMSLISKNCGSWNQLRRIQADESSKWQISFAKSKAGIIHYVSRSIKSRVKNCNHLISYSQVRSMPRR